MDPEDHPTPWSHAGTTNDALRVIRNQLTGRELRKIELIQAGLLVYLQDYLQSLQDNSVDDERDQDGLRNVASIVLMLASAGSNFTHPILQSNIIPMLLGRLRSCTVIGAARTTSVILACLNKIADHLPLQAESAWLADQRLAGALYTADNARNLVTIIELVHVANKPTNLNSILAALNLILKTCLLTEQKDILKHNGILAALSSCLCYADHHLKQNHSKSASSDTTIGLLPERSHCLALLATALQVVCLFTEDSLTDAQDFIALDSVRALFEGRQESNGRAFNSNAYPTSLPNTDLWPQFPALSTVAHAPPTTRRRSSIIRHDPLSKDAVDDGSQAMHDRGMSWLCRIVRAERGIVRVMAIRMLAVLKNHNLLDHSKLRDISALIVPCLVQMLPSQRPSLTPNIDDAVSDTVPATLALIIRDDETLQDVAFASQAIPRLTAALKFNLEVKQDLEQRAWLPRRQSHEGNCTSPTSCLGYNGPSQHARRNMLQREGILQALASIAPARDAYRRDICDHGAITQIILALEPFGSSVHPDVYGNTKLFHGNSPETLIAACGTVRVLTRSATALRTRLVDADIAKSILNLLNHSDPRVRVAATMVIANLAHDFSPMKTSVCEKHVIRRLCNQAHSAHPKLRLESLFALKALVNNSTNALKRQVVEELNPSWIKLLIGTDPQDIPPGEVIGLTPSAHDKDAHSWTSDAIPYMTSGADQRDIEDFSSRTVQDDIEIQAELLAFLRNLITGEQPAEVIDYLFEHIGKDDFLHILLDRLTTPETVVPRLSCQSVLSNLSINIVTHTLYVLSHLCAAGPTYRNTICYNTLLMKHVIHLLRSQSPSIQSASCWLINNIVHPMNQRELREDIARAREMQKLGAFAEIKKLESSTSADVIERAKSVSEVCRQLFSIAQ